MKAIFVSIYSIFAITALITHVWTVVIAFTEAGFFGGIATLCLPVLAEIYWMIKMFGENDLYAGIALIHLLLALPVSMFERQNEQSL